jgi:hypothetical protein
VTQAQKTRYGERRLPVLITLMHLRVTMRKRRRMRRKKRKRRW